MIGESELTNKIKNQFMGGNNGYDKKK